LIERKGSLQGKGQRRSTVSELMTRDVPGGRREKKTTE